MGMSACQRSQICKIVLNHLARSSKSMVAGGEITLKLFPAVCSGMTTLPGHAEGTVLAADPLEPFPLPDSALQCLTTCREAIGCQRTARHVSIFVAQYFSYSVSIFAQ